MNIFILFAVIFSSSYAAPQKRDFGKHGIQEQSPRIFIYGGEGPSNNNLKPKAEIVDLLNPNWICQFKTDVLDIFNAKSASVGGYVHETPLICGGSDNIGGTNSCLPYDDISLNQSRILASSVVIYNETVLEGEKFLSQELWITGGYNTETGEDFSSTEIVSLLEGTSRSGIELPVTVNSHCMVKYNSTHVYLIGGYQNGRISKKTWIFDPTKNYEYVEGPELNEERYWHSCGKFYNQGKEFIIVAGGVNGYGTGIDSVELFGTDHSNDGGFSAPIEIKLPYPIWHSTMVTAPDGNGVYLIGGAFGDNLSSDTILEFKQSDDEFGGEYIWEESGTKLQNARRNHVAFHVPEEETACFIKIPSV